MITLTGPGGVGKSRLAIAAAARASGAFTDGVVWVGLDAVRDASLVFPTIALALGVKDELQDWLRERCLLLVLDNLEQVLGVAPGHRPAGCRRSAPQHPRDEPRATPDPRRARVRGCAASRGGRGRAVCGPLGRRCRER